MKKATVITRDLKAECPDCYEPVLVVEGTALCECGPVTPVTEETWEELVLSCPGCGLTTRATGHDSTATCSNGHEFTWPQGTSA